MFTSQCEGPVVKRSGSVSTPTVDKGTLVSRCYPWLWRCRTPAQGRPLKLEQGYARWHVKMQARPWTIYVTLEFGTQKIFLHSSTFNTQTFTHSYPFSRWWISYYFTFATTTHSHNVFSSKAFNTQFPSSQQPGARRCRCCAGCLPNSSSEPGRTARVKPDVL